MVVGALRGRRSGCVHAHLLQHITWIHRMHKYTFWNIGENAANTQPSQLVFRLEGSFVGCVGASSRC